MPMMFDHLSVMDMASEIVAMCICATERAKSARSFR
jgi:hypothetical protein